MAIVAAALPASPSAATGDPAYSSQAARTWSVTGGQVNAMVRLGDRVVIGGTFTGLRSPAGVTFDRSRIALVDANSGAPVPAWTPSVNGPVRALATDGQRVYVGGAFTS